MDMTLNRSGLVLGGWCRRLLGLACVLALALPARAAEPAATTTGLLISYQVAPAQRPALRQALGTTTRSRLQRLKDGGALASYRLLFSRHADSELWDAPAVVTFSGPVQAARWREVERSTPAALDATALALLTSVHTVPVELVRAHAPATAPTSPVVLVIPYQSLVSAGDYLAYADGYVIPQFEGWMRESVLSQFAIFASSYAAGRPWSHMILLDYRSEEALAARAGVVAKVRAQLKDQPAWRSISESKAKVREEKQAVVADDITDGEVGR